MGYDDGSASKDSYCISVHLKIAVQFTGTPTQSFRIAYWRYEGKQNKKGDALRANRCASLIVIELAYSLSCTRRKRKKIP